MAAKQTASSMNSQPQLFPGERPDTIQSEEESAKYVIQRSGELIREWWTGASWTEDVNDAQQYLGEPDVSVETLDESAIAVRVEDLD